MPLLNICCDMMELDKELYRQVYNLHRQWFEAEQRERVRTAPQRTTEKAWQQFIDLWESGCKMGLQPSQWQQEQKIASLITYYEQIQVLEAWRKSLNQEVWLFDLLE